jgi:hypothetical protein
MRRRFGAILAIAVLLTPAAVQAVEPDEVLVNLQLEEQAAGPGRLSRRVRPIDPEVAYSVLVSLSNREIASLI